MSNGFLSNFMRAAQTVTRAERCVAIDIQKSVLDRINVSDDVLANERFGKLLHNSVEEAITTAEAVITNNLITDPEQAPQTNVHLHDLRMVVAIPLAEHGAVYLDQHIRQGVFERNMIEKLTVLGRTLIAEGKTDLSSDDFVALYRKL
jgi:hypothetical protein